MSLLALCLAQSSGFRCVLLVSLISFIYWDVSWWDESLIPRAVERTPQLTELSPGSLSQCEKNSLSSALL